MLKTSTVPPLDYMCLLRTRQYWGRFPTEQDILVNNGVLWPVLLRQAKTSSLGEGRAVWLHCIIVVTIILETLMLLNSTLTVMLLAAAPPVPVGCHACFIV